MSIIEAKDLVKVFKMGENEVTALKGVSLTVEKGELLAITGFSGSGKSTLMHILGCLDIPTSGTYILDGVDASHASRDELAKIRNQKIGFVFQKFYLQDLWLL
jgi:putative ABC transport system ATP-binding protein